MKSLHLSKRFLVLAIVALGLFLIAGLVYAGTFTQGPTAKPSSEGGYVDYTFFTATTTNATSTNVIASFDANGVRDDGSINIAGADRLTFYFGRGGATGANTGVSRFEVEASPDGTNWYDVGRLIGSDVSATATSSWSIVAATTTVYASVDLSQHNFIKARCINVETTDGEATCRAQAFWGE